MDTAVCRTGMYIIKKEYLDTKVHLLARCQNECLKDSVTRRNGSEGRAAFLRDGQTRPDQTTPQIRKAKRILPPLDMQLGDSAGLLLTTEYQDDWRGCVATLDGPTYGLCEQIRHSFQ